MTKRAQYGAVGIPAYLLIDIRPMAEGYPPHLALYENLTAGRYPEAEGDGSRVSLRIGRHPIPIDATDLQR